MDVKRQNKIGMGLDAEVVHYSSLVSQRLPFQCRNIPELSPTLVISHDSPQKLFFYPLSPFRFKSSKMEPEHNEPIMRAQDTAGSPAKKASPARAKKTVSAAAVFGKHKRVNYDIFIPRKIKSRSKSTEEDAEAAKLLSVKSHSSPRSTEERISKNRPSDMHPLSLAFESRQQHSYQRH